MPVPSAASETAGRILDTAEQLVQTRGFNRFSYADIAEALRVEGIGALPLPEQGRAGRSPDRAVPVLLHGRAGPHRRSRLDAASTLRAYIAIYLEVLDNNRMCLCGMMAADYATLPKSMQAASGSSSTPTRRGFQACCRAAARAAS